MKRTVFITDGMVELLIPQVPLMEVISLTFNIL